MQCAFRTFVSLMGVGSACYLLANATWQQVLLSFLLAGIGWCWFALSADRKHKVVSDFSDLRVHTPPPVVSQVQMQMMPAHAPQMAQPSQRIYRFPINALTRTAETRSANSE